MWQNLFVGVPPAPLASSIYIFLLSHLSSFDWTFAGKPYIFPHFGNGRGGRSNTHRRHISAKWHRTRTIFRSENGRVSAVAVSFLYCLRIEWKNRNKLNKLQFEMYLAMFMRLCTLYSTTDYTRAARRYVPCVCLPNWSVCCVQINRRRENTYLQINRFTIWISAKSAGSEYAFSRFYSSENTDRSKNGCPRALYTHMYMKHVNYFNCKFTFGVCDENRTTLTIRRTTKRVQCTAIGLFIKHDWFSSLFRIRRTDDRRHTVHPFKRKCLINIFEDR